MSQRYTGMPTWKKVVAGAVAAAVAAGGLGAAVHYAAHPSWMAWTPPTAIPGTPTATATNTVAPPTATNTATATSTSTPIPPTATSTNTPAGPTATPTPTNTAPAGGGVAPTDTPFATPTGTYTSGSLATPAATPTSLAMPQPAMQVASWVGPAYQQTPQPTATFTLAATPTPNGHSQFVDLYVAPTGSDVTTNSYCTDVNNPCKSVKYASQFAAPGDTIHLASGLYPPQEVMTGISGSDDAHRITITGPVDGSAIIAHPYPASDTEMQRPLIHLIKNRYITLQYLTIIGMQTGRDDFVNAVEAGKFAATTDTNIVCSGAGTEDYPECAPGAGDVQDDDGGDTDYPYIDYLHLTVMDTTGSCLKVAGGALVAYDLLENCGFLGGTYGGGSYSNDNYTHGVYITVGNVAVHDNTIVTASAYGISAHQTGATVDNTLVYDNVLAGTFNSAPLGSDAGGARVWFYDNIVHDLDTGKGTDAIQLAGGNVAFGNVIYNADHQRKIGMNPELGGDTGATGHGPTLPQYVLNNTIYSAACCAANAQIGGLNGSNGAVVGPIVAENNIFAETSKDYTGAATFQYPWDALFNTTPYKTPAAGTPTPTPQAAPYPTVGPNVIDYNDYLGANPYGNGSCNGASCSGTTFDGGHSLAAGTDPLFVQGTPTVYAGSPTPVSTIGPYNLRLKANSPDAFAGANVGLQPCPTVTVGPSTPTPTSWYPIGAYCP